MKFSALVAIVAVGPMAAQAICIDSFVFPIAGGDPGVPCGVGTFCPLATDLCSLDAPFLNSIAFCCPDIGGINCQPMTKQIQCRTPHPGKVPTVPGPGGGVRGDPHIHAFVGGQYCFEGEARKVFALMSDADIQINSEFVPADPEERFPGTYLGDIGIRTANHKVRLSVHGDWQVDGVEQDFGGSSTLDGVYVSELLPVLEPAHAGQCEQDSQTGSWTRSVQDLNRSCMDAQGSVLVHDDEDSCLLQDVCMTTGWMDVNAQHKSKADIEVHERWRHAWKVQSEHFDMTFYTEAKANLHFDVQADIRNAKAWTGGLDTPHGLIGQTVVGEPRQCLGQHGEGGIEGQESDYAVNGGLFSTNFAFNRFGNSTKAQARKLLGVAHELQYVQAGVWE